MADVLLIYPKLGYDVRRINTCAPLSLLSVTRLLPPDFSVRILDERADDAFWNSLRLELAASLRLVGITSMTGPQIYFGLEITTFVKAHSSVPVVWGGIHATVCTAQTIAKPYIDFVIRGEAEHALRKLMETLSENHPSFDGVPGLVWKERGRTYSTPLAAPIEMSRLPRLPWHLVDVEEYASPPQFLYNGARRFLPFEGSRGCPFKCTYCSGPALTRKYRTDESDILTVRNGPFRRPDISLQAREANA